MGRRNVRLARLAAVVAVAMAALALMPVHAHAREWPEPEPRELDLGDGLVFRVTPHEFLADGYLPSGLYRDGELVYESNWEWFEWPCFAADGMAFADRANEWHGPLTGISGYGHGEGNWRVYAADLLIDGMPLAPSPYAPFWGPPWMRTSSCDSEGGSLQIETIQGRRYVIDLMSGQVIRVPATPFHLVTRVVTMLNLRTLISIGISQLSSQMPLIGS